MNAFFVWILMLTLPSGMDDHAIYLSVIEADVATERIEVVIKVFEDDLQDALRSLPEHLKFEEKVERYFGQRLRFESTKSPSLQRHWPEGDSYRIAMIYKRPSDHKNLSVSASYFMELFPTQQNILKLSVEDKRYYHIFKKPDEVFTTTLTD